jgi:hypothetical protein
MLNYFEPLYFINLQMFTAQGAQMPIRQIRCKGTEKYAQMQEKRAKVYFWARFSCIWAA